MSTLSTANIQSKAANTPPVIKDLNGTECGTFCRAWVNFNGSGTVAIRDSFNVSSITDNNTGDYTVNFAAAMPDANYATTGVCVGTSSNSYSTIAGSAATGSYTTSSVRFSVRNMATPATLQDFEIVSIAIFR